MDRLALDKLKNAMDEAKSAVKAKLGTDVEKKMEDALSNKNWGASSTLLNEISQLTFDYESYHVIMRKIWEAIDCHARQWRTVYKGLTLLEHLLKNATERVVEDARNHMFKLRQLIEFAYHDGSADKGAGVRDKAKQILELLNDNDRISEERDKSRRLRDKYIGISSGGGIGSASSFSGGYSNSGGFSSEYSKSSRGYNGANLYGKRISNENRTNVSRDNGYESRDKNSSDGEDSAEETEERPSQRTVSQKSKQTKSKREEVEKPKAPAPSLLDDDFFTGATFSSPNPGNAIFDPFGVPQKSDSSDSNRVISAQQVTLDPFTPSAFNTGPSTIASFQTSFPPQNASMFAPMAAPQMLGTQVESSRHATMAQGTSHATVSQAPVRSVPNVKAAESNDAWGAGSSLFDLNNLSSSARSNQNSQMRNMNSFSGLDTLAGLPVKPMGNMQPAMMRPVNMGTGYMGQQGNVGHGQMGPQAHGNMGFANVCLANMGQQAYGQPMYGNMGHQAHGNLGQQQHANIGPLMQGYMGQQQHVNTGQHQHTNMGQPFHGNVGQQTHVNMGMHPSINARPMNAGPNIQQSASMPTTQTHLQQQNAFHNPF